MSTAYIKKLCRVLLAGVFSVTSIAISSNAQAEGWYAGLGFGESSVDSEEIPFFTGSVDDKDSGWKLFGGYQFNPNGAVEFGYIDLGEFKVDGTALGFAATETDEAKGFNVSLVGKLPIGSQFAVLGRIGLFRWDVDTSCRLGALDCSGSASGTDLTYGIGAQFDFSKSAGVRLEWEQFKDLGDSNTAEGDVELLSLSVVFRLN